MGAEDEPFHSGHLVTMLFSFDEGKAFAVFPLDGCLAIKVRADAGRPVFAGVGRSARL